MADFFALYGVCEDAEEQGVWVPHGDVEFLIARQGNSRHMRMMTKSFEANKHLLEVGDNASQEAKDFADKLNRKLLTEVTSKSILLGWRGRKIGKDAAGNDIIGKVLYKGAELTYTVENAQTLLGHKDFANWVGTEATKLANFLQVAQEGEEKNSVTSSAGSSSGATASNTYLA